MVRIKRVVKSPEYRIYKNGRLIAGSNSESTMTRQAERMKEKDSGAQIEIVKYQVIAKVIL